MPVTHAYGWFGSLLVLENLFARISFCGVRQCIARIAKTPIASVVSISPLSHSYPCDE